MKLARLAEAVDMDPGEHGEDQVTGFAIDHRKVAPGTVFGAFQGMVVNGEDFIPAAIAAGAIAVVARPEAVVSGAAHIADLQPRRAFARLAAQFFRPVPDTVVAVTGTNGKTSTVEMTRQIWRMCGHRAASIGTLVHGVTRAVADGYAYEDWHWMLETYRDGYVHRVVPETIHFKRRREGSQYVQARARSVLTRPSELLDFAWWQERDRRV